MPDQTVTLTHSGEYKEFKHGEIINTFLTSLTDPSQCGIYSIPDDLDMLEGREWNPLGRNDYQLQTTSKDPKIPKYFISHGLNIKKNLTYKLSTIIAEILIYLVQNQGFDLTIHRLVIMSVLCRKFSPNITQNNRNNAMLIEGVDYMRLNNSKGGGKRKSKKNKINRRKVRKNKKNSKRKNSKRKNSKRIN